MSQSILTRSLQVIDAVSTSEQGLRYSHIAQELGHPSPATVTKILKELTRNNVLKKTESGRYTLGRRTYFWGRTMAAKNTTIQIIRSAMDTLHQEFRASVNVFTCIDQRMFCLESIMNPESPALWPAGKSLALHLSVMGAVFFIPEDKLQDESFLQQEIAGHEEDLDLASVQEMIAETRTSGLQDDKGLFFPGMRRLAVPLREKGVPLMVLGLGVMPLRVQRRPELLDQLIQRLKSTQKDIESFLN